MAEREVKAWAIVDALGAIVDLKSGRGEVWGMRHGADLSRWPSNGEHVVPVKITYDDGKDEGGRADG